MRHLTIAALAALMLVAGAVSASAERPEGCAAGWEEWDVATEPYKVDDDVDREGNADGLVCARAMGEGHSKQRGTDMTIYRFTDNTMMQPPAETPAS